MARVLVPLAAGFEEIEAVTIVDVLRRADVAVCRGHPRGQARAPRPPPQFPPPAPLSQRQ